MKNLFENIGFSIESGGNYRNYLKIIIKNIYSLIRINKHFILHRLYVLKNVRLYLLATGISDGHSMDTTGIIRMSMK